MSISSATRLWPAHTLETSGKARLGINILLGCYLSHFESRSQSLRAPCLELVNSFEAEGRKDTVENTAAAGSSIAESTQFLSRCVPLPPQFTPRSGSQRAVPILPPACGNGMGWGHGVLTGDLRRRRGIGCLDRSAVSGGLFRLNCAVVRLDAGSPPSTRPPDTRARRGAQHRAPALAEWRGRRPVGQRSAPGCLANRRQRPGPARTAGVRRVRAH